MMPEAPAPLAAPVIDSHCHLDVVRYGAADADVLPVDEALRRAGEANVTRIVQIGCDRPGARWAVEAADTYDQVVAGVALHPNEIPALLASGTLDEALAEIDELAGSERVRAIGETGLDHFRTPEDGWKGQEDAFRAHIELAKRHGKALVIHDRDAHADILRVLDDEGAPERVVMHCFSGDAAFARECVAAGYYLSFAGTVTYKNSNGLRAALAETPLDRVLVETDAPYLPPVPHRGQTNGSYLLPLTVRAMAAVKEVPEEAMCAAIEASTLSALGDW
jgi:TatD DNase family protein